MPRPVLLVKLGGSLITDKTRASHARRDVIRRLAREIAALARRPRGPMLVIGHGSGSFGHVAAAAGGLSSSPAGRTAAASAVARTQRRAAELHALVMAALEDAGAAPFSLAPSSFMTGSGGRAPRVHADPLFLALDHGLVPVVYGDVVLDRTRGATIASTEEVLLAVATATQARGRRVEGAVWMGRTAGVLAPDGSTIALLSAGSAARLAREVNGTAGTDVTGGMALRLRTVATLARRGVASVIVDGRRAGVLAAAAAGRATGGTRVDVR